jgi:hypothetical protein
MLVVELGILLRSLELTGALPRLVFFFLSVSISFLTDGGLVLHFSGCFHFGRDVTKLGLHCLIRALWKFQGRLLYLLLL